jgi:four helix bundle protein
MSDYRGLKAWQCATINAVKVRDVVSRFPRRGYAELKEQMLAAAESVCHNIAEGRAASSSKDYRKFLDSAAKSASELCGQIDLARDYEIIRDQAAINLAGSVVCNIRMIRGLQSASAKNDRRRRRERKSRAPESGRVGARTGLDPDSQQRCSPRVVHHRRSPPPFTTAVHHRRSRTFIEPD